MTTEINTKNVLPQQQMMSQDPRIENKQRKELAENLERKDYILTVYQSGDQVMSANDNERQVAPRRYFQRVSLLELSEILEHVNDGFWQHPDLKADKSNASEIPFKEKMFGIITNIVVMPLSEELEKTYVESSKKDFFKHQRMFYSRDISKDFSEQSKDFAKAENE